MKRDPTGGETRDGDETRRERRFVMQRTRILLFRGYKKRRAKISLAKGIIWEEFSFERGGQRDLLDKEGKRVFPRAILARSVAGG